jgi:peptidoglycan hydrolase-like protein with peptidoglycan-binding domain
LPCNINYGSKNQKVKCLQIFLKSKNYYNRTIDSYYGKYLKKAVTAYQKQYKIKADGWAGPQTTQHMEKHGFQCNCTTSQPPPVSPDSNQENTPSIDVTPPIGAYPVLLFNLPGQETQPSIPITTLSYSQDLFDFTGSGELETPYNKIVYEALEKYGSFELYWTWKNIPPQKKELGE